MGVLEFGDGEISEKGSSAPIRRNNGKVRSSGRKRKALEPRSRATPSPAISPRRQSNLDRPTREYLTPAEVEKLPQASGKVGRHGARDRTLQGSRGPMPPMDGCGSHLKKGGTTGGIVSGVKVRCPDYIGT
jgi:hypothetical protein